MEAFSAVWCFGDLRLTGAAGILPVLYMGPMGHMGPIPHRTGATGILPVLYIDRLRR